MVRTWSVILGIGLGIVWIVGLNDPAAPGWFVWLDGVAALCSFAIAAAFPEMATRNVPASGMATGSPMTTQGSQSAAPIALAIGLFALWVIGLASHAAAWLNWWTFAFACTYVLLGVGAGVSGRRAMRARTDVERERFRRSA